VSAITVERVSKRFPGEARPAVDEVSLAVEPGSFVVLIGPSGCGKTTLLKTINRLYEPSTGRVLIDGADAAGIPATQLRRSMGYVIQQSGLFPHLRVERNIAVVPELLGWPRARIDARVDELLDLIGLPRDYRRRFPRQLSGGEQQRVGLARALAADPAVLLMDEPFGALDAITRVRLQDELLDIQRRLRKTVLFVTHDIDEALRLADVVAVMRAGRLVQYDTPLHVVTRPADDFVADLVGAGDLLRHLGVVRAGAFLAGRAPAPGSRPGEPELPADASLRDVLAALVASPGGGVLVAGDDGTRSRLTFDDIREAIVPPRARAVSGGS
jgi:osmoprotectant transport system ATP-binding protein